MFGRVLLHPHQQFYTLAKEYHLFRLSEIVYGYLIDIYSACYSARVEIVTVISRALLLADQRLNFFSKNVV